MTAYFVVANGTQTGPFTIEQIKARCSRGEIQRSTLMWREGLNEWASAEQVLEGTDTIFAGTTPPPGYASSAIAPDEAYTVPSSSDLRFSVPAEKFPAGRGVAWISGGWNLFKAAPGMWIVAILIWIGIQVALSQIPVIGSIASMLLGPSITVGLLAFAHGIEKDGRTDFGALFVGFKEKLGTLINLSLITFVLMIAVICVIFIGGFTFMGGTALLHSANPTQAIQSAMAGGGVLVFILASLIMLALGMLIMAGYLYAPGLIFFADQSPIDAMKHSFMACLDNWLPLLVYSLLAMLVCLIAMIPFGLGLIVAIPMLTAANYVCFRDMFGRQT